MDIAIICGSRNPNGQTARAAKALLEGVQAAGGAGEIVYLPQLRIERCRQCDEAGWGLCRTENRCVVQDDFERVVEKIALADAVVFATPVYYGDLAESLRAMLDRLRRICQFGDGKKRFAAKPAVGLAVAGGGGGGAPNCCVQLEKILGTIGFAVVDMIPARRQNLDLKCDICRTVGGWLGRGPSA
jgi:multimeric flavodoxin WrbA